MRDPSGSTRFWTVQVLSVNHDHDIDMQQVWAEIYESMYLKGERHWTDELEMDTINKHNEAFTEEDPLEERVLSRLNWGAPKNEWVESSMSALATDLGYDMSSNQTAAKRITSSLGVFLTKHGVDRSKTGNSVRSRLIPPLQSKQFI